MHLLDTILTSHAANGFSKQPHTFLLTILEPFFSFVVSHSKAIFSTAQAKYFDRSVSPARGQQVKQVMSKVGVVSSDALHCKEAAEAGNDVQLFGCGDDPVASSPVCHCAPWVPNCHAICQDTHDDRPTESYNQLTLQLCFLQCEVQSLWGLLSHQCGIGRPGELLCDVNSQELQ